MVESTEPQRVLYFVLVYLILMVLIETYPDDMLNYHIVSALVVLEEYLTNVLKPLLARLVE